MRQLYSVRSKAHVLVADPPWQHADALGHRGAAANYRTLICEQICNFALPEQLAKDALLFLWRMASMPDDALAVARAWGFKPHSEIVWIKTSSAFAAPAQAGLLPQAKLAFGMGRIVRGAHEVCLVCKRGRPEVRDRSVRSVFFAPRRAHSQKPEEFYAIVERLHPGPYIELFARGARRTGWRQYGDQLAPLAEVAVL